MLVLVSLGLITVYFRESSEGPLHASQRIGVSVLMPFEVAGERVARPFRDGWAWMSDLLGAKDENEKLREEVQAEVRGRDMLTGLPKTVILSSEEVRHALEEPVSQIIDAIRSTLDKTPPELAADIMDRGIVLAGGGALLSGLDERLRHETQMPVHLAESPLTCVAVGSGRSLEEFEAIHRSSRAKSRRNGRGRY